MPLRLQAQRVVQLVTLQQVLRQWGQSSLQMAAGETVQRREALPQARPCQSGNAVNVKNFI